MLGLSEGEHGNHTDNSEETDLEVGGHVSGDRNLEAWVCGSLENSSFLSKEWLAKNWSYLKSCHGHIHSNLRVAVSGLV